FAIPFDRTTIDPRAGILAKGAGGIGGVIARLQASLDRLEQRQAATVDSIADNYDSKARRMRGVLIELGLDINKPATRDGAGALGGPFIPAQLPKDAMSFERRLHRIQVTRAQISRLTPPLGAVPVLKPTDGRFDRTLDRTAPALRNAAARRGDRPAEILARGAKACRQPVRRPNPRTPRPSARCRRLSARARPP